MSDYRILVTGYRDWEDTEFVCHVLETWCDLAIKAGADPVIVQGGNGNVDLTAKEFSHAHGYKGETHMAEWGKYGKSAGPKRNQKMVDLGAAICLAFIHPSSRGTKHCADAAERAGIFTLRLTPEDVEAYNMTQRAGT